MRILNSKAKANSSGNIGPWMFSSDETLKALFPNACSEPLIGGLFPVSAQHLKTTTLTKNWGYDLYLLCFESHFHSRGKNIFLPSPHRAIFPPSDICTTMTVWAEINPSPKREGGEPLPSRQIACRSLQCGGMNQHPVQGVCL